jgi:hypothetical protein
MPEGSMPVTNTRLSFFFCLSELTSSVGEEPSLHHRQLPRIPHRDTHHTVQRIPLQATPFTRSYHWLDAIATMLEDRKVYQPPTIVTKRTLRERTNIPEEHAEEQ